MKDITVKPDITIRQAMKKLSQTGEKCLVITDDVKNLLGTLSDGALRKAILKGYAVGDSINDIYTFIRKLNIKSRASKGNVSTAIANIT